VSAVGDQLRERFPKIEALTAEKAGAIARCAEAAACFMVASRARGRAGVIRSHDHEG
jgi:hypothetical protein